MNGLDFSELTKFKKELMEDIAQEFPKETQKFIDKEKRKLLREVKKTAKANAGKKTGNYYKKSKKAGKTHYNKKSKDIYAKVYADARIAPHAHLIEEGHFNIPRGESKKKIARRSGKGGQAKGFTLGKHIFKKAELAFQSTYEKDVEEFTSEFISKNIK